MAYPVLEYINTAVAVSAFLISSDLKSTVENVREYFKRNPSPLVKRFEAPQEISFLNLIIDRGLLGDLTGDVRAAINDERECLQRANRGTERDACGRRAEKSICDILNYIRNRNEDHLPTDYLEDMWKGYRCVPVGQ